MRRSVNQLYVTIGTVAAALLGLSYVVIAINASAVLGAEATAMRHLTGQALQNYVTIGKGG